jgi:hypothetical protein
MELQTNPYENVIQMFYETLIRELNKQWPDHTGELMLVFDSSNNEEWVGPLNRIHKKYHELNPRIVGSITFADDEMVAPLQAADLFAYVIRQHAQRWLARKAKGDNTLEPMRLLDFVFRKNIRIGAKDENFQIWKHTFRMMLADQRRKKAQWKREGKPNKPYYPVEHFPHLFSYERQDGA